MFKKIEEECINVYVKNLIYESQCGEMRVVICLESLKVVFTDLSELVDGHFFHQVQDQVRLSQRIGFILPQKWRVRQKSAKYYLYFKFSSKYSYRWRSSSNYQKKNCFTRLNWTSLGPTPIFRIGYFHAIFCKK